MVLFQSMRKLLNLFSGPNKISLVIKAAKGIQHMLSGLCLNLALELVS